MNEKYKYHRYLFFIIPEDEIKQEETITTHRLI